MTILNKNNGEMQLVFACFDHINIPVSTCRVNMGRKKYFQDSMAYSYKVYLRIFYMHHYTDIMTHGLPFFDQSLALVGTSQ